MVARAIHHLSAQHDMPLVKVNRAAIPESLLESELFGHVRGAFTGAITSRRGKFALADGGTIFLDEIGTMTPALQAKLLHVLQEREFEPLGSERAVRIDIRVIALDTGFSSYSHFTAAFRRAFGCTPSEFRTTARGRLRPVRLAGSIRGRCDDGCTRGLDQMMRPGLDSDVSRAPEDWGRRPRGDHSTMGERAVSGHVE
jgi:AraC-like DNA-binding protein